MPDDNPFPVGKFPGHVQRAILREFHGRCPTIREVAERPDSRWLATPGIGIRLLDKIRRITHDRRRQRRCHIPVLPQRLTDTELVDRLEFLQKELRRIEAELEFRMR